MSSVIVKTEGFPKAFPIVYWNNETGEKERETLVDAENVAEYIAADDRIEEVSLFGLREYNEGIKQHIEKLIKTDYSNHKMKVEVL